MTSVTAVVLAYGEEPWIEPCVEALLASSGVEVDVVLVDNGCTTGAPDRLADRAGVTLVRPATNLGFAGGCNEGVRHAHGEVVALVNGDALVEPAALAALAEVALRPDVGLASASVRLADEPDLLNSCGNPVHFSGLSWAGGFREPASAHPVEAEVASASGATVALRRALWDELGGFAPEYFAYLEDTELSLRCWQRGLRVLYVPQAVVRHRYAFSRNPLKQYLLERNRLVLLLTLLERRTLLTVLPALLVVELLLTALAVVQGWGASKARGWWWLLTHTTWLRQRRALLQSQRTVPDAQVLPRLTGRLSMTNVERPPGLAAVDTVLAVYWAIAKRALGAR